jgi:hypothetical protein
VPRPCGVGVRGMEVGVRPVVEPLVAESGIAMSSSDRPSAATPSAAAMMPPKIMTPEPIR